MAKAKKNYDRMYPLGVTQTAEGMEILMPCEGETLELLLFHKGKEKPAEQIPFKEEEKIGDVWTMSLPGVDLTGMQYSFLADGKPFSDPYARSVTGRETWGELRVRPVWACIPSGHFEWGRDRNPEIPYAETILYRLHVRGFTKMENSGVKHGGTFAGLAEKIPYLKDLGVTSVELMPVTEFDEVFIKTSVQESGAPGGHVEMKSEPTGKINYWGYGPSFLYALKKSYGVGRQPVETEFKSLVKELHKEQMECIMDLFFTGTETPGQVLDVLRYWVREYHVDGFRLSGAFPAEEVAADPFLRRTKLFAENWGQKTGTNQKSVHTGKTEGPVPVNMKNLAVYQSRFQNTMRQFLNGGDSDMERVMEQISENPESFGAVHYMANTDGFTMMDMVSYNEKHNWENGEENQDGPGFNGSWNCGEEGPTENERVLKLRKQQLKNGFLLLLLSQGTPLILAGDEFGNSQNGNNNAYCQDNETGWLDWNLLEENRDLYEFVKKMIRFRRAHKMFHMDHPAKRADYRSFGCPDMSFHGESAWKPDTAPFRRQLGILYWGPYWTKDGNAAEDSYYVAYNMHFGTHRLGLPRLPMGYVWREVCSTSETPAEVRERIQAIVPPRSIVIFKAEGESGSVIYPTPAGDMTIVCRDGGITEIGFGRREPEENENGADAAAQETPELLKLAYRQLMEYFAGERREFRLPLKPEGTEFQKKVWNALREIPYGETRSYGEIAARIGDPKASRAVGMANNRNPLAIVVPCHRVVGADGALTGYAGGLAVKEYLLKLERGE